MAVFTHVRRLNVFRIFPGGVRAVMAGATSAQDLHVVDSRHRRKRVRVMAIFADIRRSNVCWVLTSRRVAVVAAGTVVCDIHMIEIHRQPGHSAVTIVAGVIARNVRRVLANRNDAVVA